jgi:hypothetical protein
VLTICSKKECKHYRIAVQTGAGVACQDFPIASKIIFMFNISLLQTKLNLIKISASETA